MPSASEKSIASEVKERVPGRLVSAARTPDRLILRLNKYAPESPGKDEITMLIALTDYLPTLAA